MSVLLTDHKLKIEMLCTDVAHLGGSDADKPCTIF